MNLARLDRRTIACMLSLDWPFTLVTKMPVHASWKEALRHNGQSEINVSEVTNVAHVLGRTLTA